MSKVALLIEYIGQNFHGSQAQKNLRTVQEDLETACSIFLRQPIKIYLSGRTDSGVHAKGQVAHVVLPVNEDLKYFVWSINGILQPDISIKLAQTVDDTFHARFSAISRTYTYKILNSCQRSAIYSKDHFFVRTRLDTASMQTAMLSLIGTHDFKAFKSSNSDNLTTICQISNVNLVNLDEDRLSFVIQANHFVYNMVRIIIGSLVEIGLKKMEPHIIKEAIQTGNRSILGPTAPAWGLTLDCVHYPPSYNLFNNPFV